MKYSGNDEILEERMVNRLGIFAIVAGCEHDNHLQLRKHSQYLVTVTGDEIGSHKPITDLR